MATVNGFDRRSLQVGRGFRVLGPPLVDDLARRYSALADDGGQSKEKREAFALIASAEAHLQEGGSGDAALSAAEAALAAAEGADHNDALADALRLVVKAQCLRAQHLASGAERSLAPTAAEATAKAVKAARRTLIKAERLLQKKASEFQQVGFVRGEALMKVSQAEIDLQRGGLNGFVAAAELAAEAASELEAVGEVQGMALAQLVKVAALVASGDSCAAPAEADVAVGHFRQLGERRGEAHALHLLALSRALGGTRVAYEEATRYALDALSLYRELQLWKCCCSVELSMGRLSLERERPDQAVQAAREALALMQEFGGSVELERVAFGMLAQAYMDDDEEEQALQVARETVYRYKAAGNLRQEVLALDNLAGLLRVAGSTDDATLEANSALALSRECRDADLEARLLLRLAGIHSEAGLDDEALQAAEDAATLWEANGEAEEYAEQLACASYHMVGILLRMFDPKDSMKEASKARAFFAHAGDKYREAVTLVSIATISYSSGQVDEAIEALQFAKDMFREVSDPKGEAKALNMLAEFYRNQGNFREALDVSLMNRAIVQEAGWSWEEIKALGVLSSLHRQLQDMKAAGRAAREGVRMARAVGQKEMQGQLLSQAVQCNLALISESGGADKVSRNLIEETTRLARDAVTLTSNPAGGLPSGGWRRQAHPSALFWQAQVLATTSHEDALLLLAKADEVCKETGQRQVQAHCLLLGAQLQLAANRRDKAEQMLRPAMDMMKEIGDTDGLQLAEEVMKKVSGAGADPGAAPAPRYDAPQEQVPAAESNVAVAPKMSRQAIKAQILEIAQNALASDDEVHEDTPLMDSGMDSLTSVSFRNEVSQAFETNLPASLIFDYPSIGEITSYVADLMK